MFGSEMLYNTETNIALRSLQVLYIFALRAEKDAIFELRLTRKS